MLEIRTSDGTRNSSGDKYIVMGQRVLKNGQRLKHKNCPIVLWVGSCDSDGSRTTRRLVLGRTLCISFNSGLYINGTITAITETD